MARYVVALLVAIAASSPARASAAWSRYSTEHFTFISEASDSSVREIAERLEQFRAVFGELFSRDAIVSPVPTIVVVFQGDRSFAPFRPLFNGKPVAAGGYFLGGEDAQYIAINARQGRAASRVILHEYTHAIVRNLLGDVPTWVSEGLAQFYETFETTAGGKAALVGVPDETLRWLATAAGTPLPIRELIAVTGDSPAYNEGDRRVVFYAQSWALVHYLTIGNPSRSGQLRAYLRALAAGGQDPAAFHEAFGSDDAVLEGELRRYLRALKLNAVRIELAAQPGPAEASTPLAIVDEEAAGYLGELLVRLGRSDDARRYLKKTIDGNSGAARAIAALGTLELRAGNNDAALPLLERAAALAPDAASIQAAYARALTLRANAGNADEDALRTRARSALTRAIELEPGNVSTAVILAEIELGSGENPERAVALMQKAVAAAPGREEYRLMLAEARAMSGDYAQASNDLGLLVARGRRQETRDRARQLLARVAAARNAAVQRTIDADPPPSSAPDNVR